MKTFPVKIALALLAIVVISQVNSLPVGEEAALAGGEGAHVRVRRFTCDVLSVEFGTVKINHAACGAHCLFRGRTGGYCNGKRVCICR